MVSLTLLASACALLALSPASAVPIHKLRAHQHGSSEIEVQTVGKLEVKGVAAGSPEYDKAITLACYERQPGHSRVWFSTEAGATKSTVGPAWMVDLGTSKYNFKFTKGLNGAGVSFADFCTCHNAKADVTVKEAQDIAGLYCKANPSYGGDNHCRRFAGYFYHTVTGSNPPKLGKDAQGCNNKGPSGSTASDSTVDTTSPNDVDPTSVDKCAVTFV